jgi:hypothetical protein
MYNVVFFGASELDSEYEELIAGSVIVGGPGFL